jgi:hypothetical protein
MSHYQTSLRTLEFIVGRCSEHVTGISPPVKQTARQPQFEGLTRRNAKGNA